MILELTLGYIEYSPGPVNSFLVALPKIMDNLRKGYGKVSAELTNSFHFLDQFLKYQGKLTAVP